MDDIFSGANPYLKIPVDFLYKDASMTDENGNKISLKVYSYYILAKYVDNPNKTIYHRKEY